MDPLLEETEDLRLTGKENEKKYKYRSGLR